MKRANWRMVAMAVVGAAWGAVAWGGTCPETVLDRQGNWQVVQADDEAVKTLFLEKSDGMARTPLARVEVPSATVTNVYWDEFAGWNAQSGKAVGGMVTNVETIAGEFTFRAFVNDGAVYWEDQADGVAHLWTAPCKAPEVKTALAETEFFANAKARVSPRGKQSITFNANGGKFEDGGQVVDDDINKDVYAFWYTRNFQFPTRSGFAFDGWYSTATGGTRVKDGDPVTSDASRTLYAHWVPTSGTTLAEATDCGKLTFTTEGDVPWFGQKSESHDGTDAARSGQLAPDYAWHGSSAMSASVNGPGTISFWWKADGLRTYDQWRPTTLEFLVDGEVWASLKEGPADWTQVRFGIGEGTHELKWKYQCGGRSYYYGLDCGFVDQILWKWEGKQTVTFNANGGTCGTKTAQYQVGEAYGSLPEASRAGHVFAGWFTSAASGTQVKAGDTVPEQETRTLYAHWKAAQTVTFDANGGTCAMATAVYPVGEAYGSLPEAVWNEHSFLGWHTEAGTLVTASDLVATNTPLTLHARWIKAVDGVAIANVTAHQRFPWNGLVDIAYEVFCEDPDAEVWVYPVATDAEHGHELSVGTLSGDGAGAPVKAGRHCMTWDAKADNPGAHSTALTVKMRNGKKSVQTISFAPIGAPTWQDRVELSATASSGGAVTFKVVSGPGKIDGNVLTFTGVGTVKVWAGQAGDERWLPATMTQTVMVKKVAQTIAFAPIGDQLMAARVELSATATSGLSVTFEVVSGPGVIDGNMLTFTGAGTVEVRAVQAGDDRWLPATATQTVTVVKDESDLLYMVVDLSAGSGEGAAYPVSYLTAGPAGGWTDEYKTTKLVLRRIEPGTFIMCGEYQTTLTKPYYMGVFEVTQKQYELVTGSNPSDYKGEKRPVECVSWTTIRGYIWPNSAAVDANSFMGRLRARTGLEFDLPTEAQWEYACRAGTTTDLNSGKNLSLSNPWDQDSAMDEVGRYDDNRSDGKGGYSQHTTVGSYLPNAWGLYDMHGNVWEWCLDWYGSLTSGVTDPEDSSSGSDRVTRGGSWYDYADYCTSSYRGHRSPSNEGDISDGGYGFRLVRTLSN